MFEKNFYNEYLYFNKGDFHYKLKEYKKAMEYYTKAIELNSGNDIYYIKRGESYYKLEEYEK